MLASLHLSLFIQPASRLFSKRMVLEEWTYSTYLPCSYYKQSLRWKGAWNIYLQEMTSILSTLGTCDLAFIVIVAHCESFRCSMGKSLYYPSSRAVLFNINAANIWSYWVIKIWLVWMKKWIFNFIYIQSI